MFNHFPGGRINRQVKATKEATIISSLRDDGIFYHERRIKLFMVVRADDDIHALNVFSYLFICFGTKMREEQNCLRTLFSNFCNQIKQSFYRLVHFQFEKRDVSVHRCSQTDDTDL